MTGERVGDEETDQLAAICTLQFAAVDQLLDGIRAAATLGLGFEAQSLMAFDDPTDISSPAVEVYNLRLRGRAPYPDELGDERLVMPEEEQQHECPVSADRSSSAGARHDLG